jgi:hypothetical protein
MGGNVVMLLRRVRPQRVRRLVNLEGFGMPATRPQQAPEAPGAVAGRAGRPGALRLRRSGRGGRAAVANPAADAPTRPPGWRRTGRALGAEGRWQILGDPAHKRVNPMLYHVDEVLETWKCITAPVLWVEGDLRPTPAVVGPPLSAAEFDARLAVVPQVTRAELAPAATCCTTTSPRRWLTTCGGSWRRGDMRELRVCTQAPRPPWTSNTSTQIGTLLADLSARTQQLRGYL